VAKVRRNAPCPCGSGNKAKHCCHGPVKSLDVRIMPLEIYRDSICELADTTRDEFEDLFGELADLPEQDLSLQVPLPSIWTPAIERAVSALDDDDEEAFDTALSDVVSRIDTTVSRLLLGRAVVILRDAGAISKKLAALAIIELDREDSAFFRSSVAESLAVLAGDQRTPSGLLVAAR
jgi:SEC-C motif